jgi:hypothetical protein
MCWIGSKSCLHWLQVYVVFFGSVVLRGHLQWELWLNLNMVQITLDARCPILVNIVWSTSENLHNIDITKTLTCHCIFKIFSCLTGFLYFFTLFPFPLVPFFIFSSSYLHHSAHFLWQLGLILLHLWYKYSFSENFGIQNVIIWTGNIYWNRPFPSHSYFPFYFHV